MKKNYLFIKLLSLLLIVSACSKDDDGSNPVDRSEFAVAFENPSVSFADDEETKELKIVFSRPAPEAGKAVINYTTVNTDYNNDFITVPSGETGTITVDIKPGTDESVFTFTKQGTIDGVVTKTVTFYLESLSYDYASISGNTDLVVSYSETPALGGSIALETGGPTYPNQVYIDLSSQSQTPVRRDIWELAFYSGSENKVFLNPAIRVSAVNLVQFTDLNEVTSTTSFSPPLEINARDVFTGTNFDVTINTVEEYKEGAITSYGMYGPYVDAKDGSTTAISEISLTDADNKVYLVYMGTEIPSEPGSSSTTTTGDDRGWYKIRVTMDGDNYKLQYAELDATSFTEVTIAKNASLNSVAFSLTNNEVVSVEPAKEKWDINFSGVYTSASEGATYTDYAVHNTLGGTGLYQVTTYESNGGVITELDVPSYEDFALSDVEEASLEFATRNIIGSAWRSVFGTVGVRDDRYYIVKDDADNYYKLRFTDLLNDGGERGYPAFEYSLLQ